MFNKTIEKSIENQTNSWRCLNPVSTPRQFFLLFSHKLSSAQADRAKNEFRTDKFIEMPEQLKQLWQQIPPGIDGLGKYLLPIKRWIDKMARKNDILLIQGDFGATYLMVNFAIEKNLVPVYATTKRNAVEKTLDDGSIKMEHIFSFCRFRRYGQ